MAKLDGKVAVITGAARGIGKADAFLFTKEGASVVVSDIDDAVLMETVAEIESTGGKVAGCSGDVRQSEDCQRIMEMAASKFGRLDILVNNAGITRDALIPRMTDDQWNTVIDICLKGTFNCIRAASKYMMKENHNGRIINISSISGVNGNTGQINYSSAKMGLIGMTKTVAAEWAKYGITCNAIAYGFIDTRLTRAKEEQGEVVDGEVVGIPKKIRNMMLELMTPMTPEDAAKPVLFLASEESASITGQVFDEKGNMYKAMTL